MRVLIIDDEKNIRLAFATALESSGHQADAVATGAAGLNQLRQFPYQVVFLDLKLQKENGLDLLEEILKINPRVAVVMVTAFASVETAVEAMRRGAFDYLPKPCTPDQVRQVLERIGQVRQLEQRVRDLEAQFQQEFPELELRSESPVMKRALEIALKAAPSPATVLLLGESGTGKNVLARMIHQHSARAGAAFVTVSCPSLSRDLLESELFGHARGAFTGAHTETTGKVALAEAGTLFLDEIGELPLEIQAKLLRLLQDQEYERLGDPRPRRADVRVVAATNRDLTKSIADGRFREDLFYRLNVISIQLPALRDRGPDLQQIADTQLRFFANRSGKKILGFTEKAKEALAGYPWPGNLRELRNVVERAVILGSSDKIDLEDLPELASSAGPEIRLGARISLETIENEHIRRVLEQSATIEDAATVLQINPATLYRRKKKF
jgi:two-component system, NtrC family, response regulator AlgB